MNIPGETELAGLKKLVTWVRKKNCEDITGKPCGAILSDECDTCIEVESALEWLKEMMEEVERLNAEEKL